MSAPSPWVNDENAALFTDLYELTMLQAYWREGLSEQAAFSMFFRELPASRNYVVACGLDDALRYLERLQFTEEAIGYLRTVGGFSEGFLDWLRGFRFRGDVYAVAEGTPVFPEEPLLEILAPIAEAQLAETFLMNQIHYQSVAASKAARVVTAARGRTVVDFGLRRMHGTDAGMKGARAFYVGGVASTSNVLAGHVYGIPIAGTMAHSYIEAHDSEGDAFREFAKLYPETILLVDTYETLEGVRRLVDLAGDSRVRGVRLDSGDLAELAFAARKILDEAGLEHVDIFASGGLDEFEIAKLVASGAPIGGFGVGTRMGVAQDAPSLDMVYKLTAYAGRGRVKTSPGKHTLPGRKQVFRVEEASRAVCDVIARHDEDLPGRPLLEPVMRGGERLEAGRADLRRARECAAEEIAKLPDRVRALERADPPYRVEISRALAKDRREASERAAGAERAARRGPGSS